MSGEFKQGCFPGYQDAAKSLGCGPDAGCAAYALAEAAPQDFVSKTRGQDFMAVHSWFLEHLVPRLELLRQYGDSGTGA